MCRIRTIMYGCPVPCDNVVDVYETHCQYTGRDNVQGACGHTDYGGPQFLGYPCAQHQNFAGRSTVPLSVQNATATTRQRETGAARANWIANPDLYEQPPGMDVRNTSEEDWQFYYRAIHAGSGPAYGARYWSSSGPWGGNRRGGRY